jgi:hypothetical protein
MPGLGEVFFGEPPDQAQELSLIGRVLGRTPEAVGRYLAEELHGIAADSLPGLRIQELEERAHLGPPRPSQVVGEGEEREELLGYSGYPKGLFEDGSQLNL